MSVKRFLFHITMELGEKKIYKIKNFPPFLTMTLPQLKNEKNEKPLHIRDYETFSKTEHLRKK